MLKSPWPTAPPFSAWPCSVGPGQTTKRAHRALSSLRTCLLLPSQKGAEAKKPSALEPGACTSAILSPVVGLPGRARAAHSAPLPRWIPSQDGRRRKHFRAPHICHVGLPVLAVAFPTHCDVSPFSQVYAGHIRSAILGPQPEPLQPQALTLGLPGRRRRQINFRRLVHSA